MLCGRSRMLWSSSRNYEQRSAGGWWTKRPRTASGARASSPGGCADITAGELSPNASYQECVSETSFHVI